LAIHRVLRFHEQPSLSLVSKRCRAAPRR
jgi:hypothetical protein